MYQAIVFLPLLGAILAGLIALAGARARFPGKGPAPGGEDHATDHGAHHGGTVTHASHHAGEEHVPAAVGSRTAELITTTLLLISMILSWIAFVDVGFLHHDARVPVFTWMAAGDLKVEWSLRIDTLTAVMLVVVNTISAFVHLYSIGYMHEDPYRPRFFGYLSMFTFAMLMLVTADNLVQLFFGWEGVGLASYLLIGFWYHKPEANAAAIKAFIVNRVGDFGFALGIFAVFMLTGAIDLDTVFAQAPALTGKTINMFGWQVDGPAGTVTVPVAVVQAVPLTTGSLPAASTGDSAYRCPASWGTARLTGSGVALSTTSTPSRRRSTSRPTVSSIRMVTTPGWACAPLPGNVTFCSIRTGSPSRNSGVENRSRSRSCADADAVATSSAVGLSAGSASSGCWYGHFAWLSAACGRPWPNTWAHRAA